RRAGRAAADGASGAAGRSYLMRIARRAMACLFEVCVNVGQYEGDMGAALDALDLIESLEDQLSVFRPTSQLNRINRGAAGGPVQVDPELLHLLQLALEISQRTGGAFDITATPLWRAWGFARRAGRVPNQSELAEALQHVGSRWVRLNDPPGTVRFLKPGIELSLGSIGKGYALDRAAEVLAEAGIGDFLVHSGQSSILARGSRMGRHTTNGSGWPVGLPDPRRRGARLGEITLYNRALATSSSAFQSFRHQGKRYGHVLDPRTGWPAEGVLSATAIAPTAAMADALATAFYVMGPEAVEDYCQHHAEVGAVLVCPLARGAGSRVLAFGIDPGQLRWFDQNAGS
ncbi:MAG TPA: FAD:protein FMN transferase, partial [Planctomycetes bacterium]|nr:FAD:protein FMN transferase [Planctomycetota bacterium]